MTTYRTMTAKETLRHGDQLEVDSGGILFSATWKPVHPSAVGTKATGGNYRRPIDPLVKSLMDALQTAMDNYTSLVDSGDAGSWDPRDEDWHKECSKILKRAKKTL